MRFDNKYGYNQLIAYDHARPVVKPRQGKLGLIVLSLIVVSLGFAIGLAM